MRSLTHSHSLPQTDALRQYGLNIVSRVEMIPQQVSVDTLRYLTTKVARMQHGISIESLKVNTAASRLWSCPNTPTHGSPPEPIAKKTADGKASRQPVCMGGYVSVCVSVCVCMCCVCVWQDVCVCVCAGMGVGGPVGVRLSATECAHVCLLPVYADV